MKNLVEEKKIPLRIALRAAFLARGTYYHTPKSRTDRLKKPLDPVLCEQLRSLKGYEQTYGYRKVTVKFGIYNHKKVYRHMRELKLTQPRKLKKHNKKRLEVSCPTRSNLRWEGDLTYVFDGRKINYLFAIVDAYDKEPIGDHYGLRSRADEAIHSLENAVKTRFGNLEPYNGYRVTLRVDQGSQYTSKRFRRRAKELGVRLEYCGINCPDDKPYIESFFARYKCEEVYRNEYRSYTDALFGWLAYKEWYSTKRIHQGLGWSTIPEFKAKRLSFSGGIFVR